ncbi:hypothetical protein GCM10007103_19450 [Salinimicrobium marinum]|uniref:DUF4198 domain-containing protein n=1 Tax=Salinimicrobium marinum TaxID=680283 RepID=A0A918SGZ3_9FLAO|nr:hypothetical protein GCM10007103_19450 [Salinimicrobium marinum]
MAAGWAHAHALYIDTNTEGTSGKIHEVKIYYSEFAERKAEKVTDWYSNVADFELWLVQPSGKRTKLSTTAHNNHYSANFTPEKNGAYRLEISHVAEDPGDGTAYQFNAFAPVMVGKKGKMIPVTTESPELVLAEEIQNINSSKRIFKTYFKGTQKEGITATLFLPSGETKEVKSNSEGILEVELDEKGIYFLEATTYHEDESGKTKKAPYKSVWRCATQKLERL